MQQFIQQLLASAAAKFWISAAGMACALIVRIWQNRLDAETDKIANIVGLAFDNALGNPDVAKVWCPGETPLHDPITQQLHDIADQIKKSADNWILTIQLGGNPGKSPARVALLNRSEDAPGDDTAEASLRAVKDRA